MTWVIHHRPPAAKSSAPTVPTARCPKRAPSSPPGNAVSPASNGPGAIMNPARSTDSCQRPVRSRTPPSTSAPKPPKKASELRSASATARWRMTAGSMMGLGCRMDRRTRPAPARTASAKAPMIRALVQPQSEPSTMAATRLATATVRRTAPTRSDLWASGSRISGSTRRPSTRATTAKGRLTRKTQRQLAWTSSPPIGGPRAAAAPPTADHRPIAAPLRAGPNAASNRPREVGSMRAPPTACRTRAPIRNSRDGERAQSADAVVKMASPSRKARLRPARSAHRPAGTRTAAKTMV